MSERLVLDNNTLLPLILVPGRKPDQAQKCLTVVKRPTPGLTPVVPTPIDSQCVDDFFTAGLDMAEAVPGQCLVVPLSSHDVTTDQRAAQARDITGHFGKLDAYLHQCLLQAMHQLPCSGSRISRWRATARNWQTSPSGRNASRKKPRL